MKSCDWGGFRRFPLASWGACGRNRWRLALVGLGVVLASCVGGLPLPVTTLQFIDGSWPAKQERAGESRPYTIRGDRLEFPDIGFGVSRPNQAEWEFRVGNDVINLLRRGPLREGGVIPRVITQVVPRPAGFDLGAYLEQELRERGRESGAILLEKGVVDGTQASIWTSDLPADNQNPAERIRRHYLFKSATITLIDCRAGTVDFEALLPPFNQIVSTVTLPRESETELAQQPADVPGAPVRRLVLPAVDVSLDLPALNWDFFVDQNVLNVAYVGAINEGEVTPLLTTTITNVQENFSFDAYAAVFRDELGKQAVGAVEMDQTSLGGVSATRYTLRRDDAERQQTITNQVWLCRYLNRLIEVQFVASVGRFEALGGDRERLIGSLRLSDALLQPGLWPDSVALR